jgi:hypothetical protein
MIEVWPKPEENNLPASAGVPGCISKSPENRGLAQYCVGELQSGANREPSDLSRRLKPATSATDKGAAGDRGRALKFIV